MTRDWTAETRGILSRLSSPESGRQLSGAFQISRRVLKQYDNYGDRDCLSEIMIEKLVLSKVNKRPIKNVSNC